MSFELQNRGDPVAPNPDALEERAAKALSAKWGEQDELGSHQARPQDLVDWLRGVVYGPPPKK